MTIQERRNPAILNGSRRRRIAQGSGTTVTDVNRLMKQFLEMKKMMQRVSKMGVRSLFSRMRPAKIEEFVGQDHLLGPGKILTSAAKTGELQSLIFWGPPGSGKTTLAQILADSAGAVCVHFSAVTSGVKDLKKIIQEAEQLQRAGQATVLFVDEIHHFNKAQQDNFLPHVERGTLTLIGATTENPSFEVISPLLSRCRVLVLKALSPADIGTIVDRALHDPNRGLGSLRLEITAPGRSFLIEQSQGDCRVALNALEAAAALAQAQGQKEIGLAHLQEALQKTPLRYDKGGDEHYNVISAFIKSMPPVPSLKLKSGARANAGLARPIDLSSSSVEDPPLPCCPAANPGASTAKARQTILTSLNLPMVLIIGRLPFDTSNHWIGSYRIRAVLSNL